MQLGGCDIKMGKRTKESAKKKLNKIDHIWMKYASFDFGTKFGILMLIYAVLVLLPSISFGNIGFRVGFFIFALIGLSKILYLMKFKS